jgi:hypothetical protein
MRLAGVPGQDIGILNVYAANRANERCELWSEILLDLPRDCRWIFVGDWNFVEKASDRSRPKVPLMTENERLLFQQLKTTFAVEDPFPLNNAVKFNWNNRKTGEQRLLARLDRVYSFSQGVPVTNSDYKIRGDNSISDHLPVFRQIWLSNQEQRRSPYVMSALYLKDPAVKERIKQIWIANARLPFFSKIRRVVKFYRQHCIQKSNDRKREEELLRRQLECTAIGLQANPGDQHLQATLARCADRLRGFEQLRAENQRLPSRLKWKSVGDQCSKEFFQATRERSTTSHITELEDVDGRVHTSQAGMAKVCQDFYQKLYSMRQPSLASGGAKYQALRYIQDRLSVRAKASLSLQISASELKHAIDDMQTGKSSGPDGLILEFYREYWDLIGLEYHQMVCESVAKGCFPSGVTEGMIALLHKGSERKFPTNWRPITLLNLSYKIYAKALQLRLQLVLMDIISPDQSAFLPLRFILDNILLTEETMAWADFSGQPLLFLKLDFSKAYDMLEWDFLFEAMVAIGLPAVFLKFVSLLFKNATANVKVNGALSESFKIERGVRQGCPLAPYLFIIATKVLNTMVTMEAATGRVKGIQLPMENRQQLIAQYADDTSFTLLGEEEPLRNLIYFLEIFCLASRLVINWRKSCGYWRARLNPLRPAWTGQLGVTWAEPNSVSKLLGAPFGLSLSTDDVNSFLFVRLCKKLSYWVTVHINPIGRGVIVNSVLNSSTFSLSIWGGNNLGVKKVKSALLNYLASGKSQRARARVNWIQCCQTRINGGLNIIHPEDAVVALMGKWLVKAMEPGQSNLHLMLHYKLSLYQPYAGGRWQPSLEFFTIQGIRVNVAH